MEAFRRLLLEDNYENMVTSYSFWIKTFVFLIHLYEASLGSTVAPPVAHYVSYANSNCAGNDIRSLASNTPADCAASCDGEPACVAFVFQYFQPSPPQFCYLKSVCGAEGLFPSNGIHSYIKGTPEETSTEDILTPSANNTALSTNEVAVTEMSFVWFTYTLDSEVSEAPLAVPIGSLMLVLLVGFIIFFVLLDTDNYLRGFKRGYKNCLRGARDRQKRKKKQVEPNKAEGSNGVVDQKAGFSQSGTNGILVTIEDTDDVETE